LRDGVGFFLLLAVLNLTFGVFHPLWLLLVCGALFWLEGGRRARLLATAAPLALVLLVTVRNVVLFHSISTGQTMERIDLGLVFSQPLPDSVKGPLIAHGHLTPLAALPFDAPYRGPEKFDRYIPQPPATGIRLYDMPRKSTGALNWHSSIYWLAGEMYGRDANYALLHYPLTYLSALPNHVRQYLNPSDQCEYIARTDSNDNNGNGHKLARALALHDLFLGGQGHEYGVPWMHVFGFPALILFAGLRVWRLRRCLFEPWADPVTRAHAVTLAYCLFCVVWVFVITVLISYGDHSRYRFMTNPFYLLFLGLLASSVATAARNRLRQRSRPVGDSRLHLADASGVSAPIACASPAATDQPESQP
jgi:hypothetical protein